MVSPVKVFQSTHGSATFGLDFFGEMELCLIGIEYQTGGVDDRHVPQVFHLYLDLCRSRGTRVSLGNFGRHLFDVDDLIVLLAAIFLQYKQRRFRFFLICHFEKEWSLRRGSWEGVKWNNGTNALNISVRVCE